MPPPMIRVSHFSSRLEITFNLSATFAPPRIATNGRYRIIYCIAEEVDLLLHQVSNYVEPPFAVMNLVTPTTEACALWEEPNASHT